MKKQDICLLNKMDNIIISSNDIFLRIKKLKEDASNGHKNINYKTINNLFSDTCYLNSNYFDLHTYLLSYRTELERQIINHNKKVLLSLGNLFFNLKKSFNDNSLGIILKKSIDYKSILLSEESEKIFNSLLSGKYKNFPEFEKIINLDDDDDDLPF